MSLSMRSVYDVIPSIHIRVVWLSFPGLITYYIMSVVVIRIFIFIPHQNGFATPLCLSPLRLYESHLSYQSFQY